MKLAYFLFGIILTFCFDACTSNNNKISMEKTESITEELTTINRLLRDTAFALTIAGGQDSNYYVSQAQKVPAFFEGPDSLLKKSFKEEKVSLGHDKQS